jgi:hypothetical protein
MRRDGRRVGGQGKQFPAFKEPEQTSLGCSGEWFVAVTAEQVQRTPAQRLCTRRPAVVNEPPAVVDEAQPPHRRDFAWRTSWIKACQRLGPSANGTAVMLDDSSTFFKIDI